MNRNKQDKAKEIFGLMKIPDDAIIKNLLIEKGKREAYIQELEYDNKQLRLKLSKYKKQ